MSIITYIIIYTIAVYGISAMLVYFNGPFGIVNKFREWVSSKHETFAELFSCMFCLPTNVGLILSVISLLMNISFTPFTLAFRGAHCLWWLILIMDALYAGASTYLIHTIQERIEKREEREVL